MRGKTLNKRSLIAILDDEYSFAKLVLETLNEIGFENIVTFETVEHLYRWSNLKDAEIVFVDINLKEANGLTLLPWLKIKAPYARIIMLSGDTRKEVVHEAINLGACSFLSKLDFSKNIRSILNQWKVNYPLV